MRPLPSCSTHQVRQGTCLACHFLARYAAEALQDISLAKLLDHASICQPYTATPRAEHKQIKAKEAHNEYVKHLQALQGPTGQTAVVIAVAGNGR